MDTPTPSNIPKPDLFSKIGPLPAWGWGVVIVGGYLIYSRMHAGPNIAQAVDNPTATDPSQYTDSNGYAGYGIGGGGGIDPASSGYNYQDVLSGSYTGTTAGTGTSFATNQQWALSVISNMPKMGYSASDVVTAVTLYLAGSPLTANQANIISVAISSFGPPPLPLPITSSDSPAPVPTTTTTAPAPTPAPAPTTSVTYPGALVGVSSTTPSGLISTDPTRPGASAPPADSGLVRREDGAYFWNGNFFASAGEGPVYTQAQAIALPTNSPVFSHPYQITSRTDVPAQYTNGWVPT